MRTLPLLSAFALLGLLALPAAAYADTFNFSAIGSGEGFSGTGSFVATADGGGTYTITGISGTDIGSLVAPGGFDGNDNLLFPAASSLVDTKGFAFTATQGDTGFTVDIAEVLSGGYQAYFLDSDGFSATIPVTFSLVNTTTPEPSSLLLLGTGVLALAGFARRRTAAQLPAAA